MKIKSAYTLMLSAALSGTMHAQQNTTAAGGNATGSGGSVSYSIGQIDYITQTGSGGTASQGVQQPYEFLVTGGAEIKGIDLGLSVFPNPSPGVVILDVSSTVTGVSRIELYDAAGKLLMNKNVSSQQTQIDIRNYESGIYFLSVFKNEGPVKQFKIIKTAR